MPPAELATTLASTEAERLEQAEAVVRGFCGWHIAPSREEKFTLNGSGTTLLVLPTLHITSVVSVTVDGTLLEADKFTWSEAGYLTRSTSWGTKTRSIEVMVIHGHNPIPAEVSALVKALAQRAVDNPGSTVRVQDGPFSETYGQTGFNQVVPLALFEAEQAILDRYRLPGMP